MPPLYTISRCYNIWAIWAVLQLASVAKSVLADKDELSQADITAMAASNFFVARMVGSDSPLQDTVLAALVAGYAMRSSASKLSLHMASTQLASAFLTTAATLGVVAAVAGLLPSIPVVGEYIPNVGKLLAVVTMHGITNRPDNGTVKEIVNGIILAGMSFDALIGGIDLALDLDTILVPPWSFFFTCRSRPWIMPVGPSWICKVVGKSESVVSAVLVLLCHWLAINICICKRTPESKSHEPLHKTLTTWKIYNILWDPWEKLWGKRIFQ